MRRFIDKTISQHSEIWDCNAAVKGYHYNIVFGVEHYFVSFLILSAELCFIYIFCVCGLLRYAVNFFCSCCDCDVSLAYFFVLTKEHQSQTRNTKSYFNILGLICWSSVIQ